MVNSNADGRTLTGRQQNRQTQVAKQSHKQTTTLCTAASLLLPAPSHTPWHGTRDVLRYGLRRRRRVSSDTLRRRRRRLHHRVLVLRHTLPLRLHRRVFFFAGQTPHGTGVCNTRAWGGPKPREQQSVTRRAHSDGKVHPHVPPVTAARLPASGKLKHHHTPL